MRAPSRRRGARAPTAREPSARRCCCRRCRRRRASDPAACLPCSHVHPRLYIAFSACKFSLACPPAPPAHLTTSPALPCPSLPCPACPPLPAGSPRSPVHVSRPAPPPPPPPLQVHTLLCIPDTTQDYRCGLVHPLPASCCIRASGGRAAPAVARPILLLKLPSATELWVCIRFPFRCPSPPCGRFRCLACVSQDPHIRFYCGGCWGAVTAGLCKCHGGAAGQPCCSCAARQHATPSCRHAQRPPPCLACLSHICCAGTLVVCLL